MWSNWPQARGLPRSLTLRLTLTFGLLGYVVVGVVTVVVYGAVRYAVYAQVDRELSTKAKVLLHRLVEDRETPDKEWLDLGEHLRLRIVDAGGRERLASPGMARLLGPERFPAPTPAGAWVEVTTPRPFRLVAVAFEGGAFFLARDGADEAYILRRLAVTLGWVFALVPLAAGVAGYGLVRFGLVPLKTVAATLAAVRPETLGQRLDETHLPSELAAMATGFNEAMARLEQAFGRLSELNSDLAHELRTPLHALRLELEGVVARGEVPPEVLEGLVGMLGRLDHLGAVIEQLLFLSRFEDPSRAVVKANLEAAALLHEAALPFDALAEERGVRLVVGAAAALRVKGDELMLRRAVQNLVSNALRHAPPDSEVRLEAVAEAGGVALRVTDQGPGMAEALAAQLGRRFLRAEASREGRVGGTGLGLAIVHRIALAHGGGVVVGRGPDGGCRIQVNLPSS